MVESVPNLKLVCAEWTPNLKLEIEVCVGFGLDPGRGSSHELHRLYFSKFRAIHTEHSHWVEDILNPFVGGAMGAATAGFGTAAEASSRMRADSYDIDSRA